MNLGSIMVSNGTGVFILLMLRYVSRARVSRRDIEDRIFAFMVTGVLLGCIAEASSYLMDGKVFFGARALNYLANTYLFTVNLLLPFCVLAYVDIGLYGDPSRIWRRYRPQIAIGAAMLMVTMLNVLVPVTFRITEGNVYERLPFGYVYYAVILYFCLCAILLVRRHNREYGSKAFFSIGAFLGPILTGAALQFMFYGLSLAWLASAIGLCGLFMMQQNELAYIDTLTGTFNRQYMDSILASWTRTERTFAGAMFDVDHFKRINDTWGHREGDLALTKVADILQRAASTGELVFRFAGDEFVVLRKDSDEEGLDPFLGRVQALCDAYNECAPTFRLALSWGTSAYGSCSIDAFLGKMDRRMYEMKATHHEREAPPTLSSLLVQGA